MTLRNIRALIAPFALAVLTACSSGDLSSDSPLTEVVKAVAPGIGKPKQTGQRPRGLNELNRAAIAGIDVPMILVFNDRTSAAATMYVQGQNAGYRTWVSGDNVSITTRNDVLSASRGLGVDLLAAETEQTIAALRARRAANYSRTYSYTGPERDVQKVTVNCALSVVGPDRVEVLERFHDTTNLSEICSGPDGLSVQNLYWIGSDGTIWQSRQWLGPNLGNLLVQRLIR